MISTIFSTMGGLTGSSISMLMLLVKATLILLVAIGITLSMQRASAGARHLVWLVTLAALLLVPALTAWGPIPIRVLPAISKSAPTPTPTPGPSVGGAPSANIDNTAPVSGTVTPIVEAAPTISLKDEIASSPVLSGLSIAFLVWAAVLLVIAASLGYATLMVHRIVNRARALDSEEIGRAHV